MQQTAIKDQKTERLEIRMQKRVKEILLNLAEQKKTSMSGMIEGLILKEFRLTNKTD